MAKVTLSIRIEQGLKDALSVLAEMDDRTLSNYIEILLREHIKKEST